MSTSKERITFLLNAYISNRISEQELAELAELSRKPASDFIVNDLLQEYWDGMRTDPQQEIPKEDIYSRITSDKRFTQALPQQQKNGAIRRLTVVLAYAAVVLLVLSAGITLYLNRGQNPIQKASETQGAKAVHPGSKKAVLTLADGSEIVLNNSVEGEIAAQGNLLLTILLAQQ